MATTSNDIRAGAAYVEIYTRDNSSDGLSKAKSNLRDAADAARATSSAFEGMDSTMRLVEVGATGATLYQWMPQIRIALVAIGQVLTTTILPVLVMVGAVIYGIVKAIQKVSEILGIWAKILGAIAGTVVFIASTIVTLPVTMTRLVAGVATGLASAIQKGAEVGWKAFSLAGQAALAGLSVAGAVTGLLSRVTSSIVGVIRGAISMAMGAVAATPGLLGALGGAMSGAGGRVTSPLTIAANTFAEAGTDAMKLSKELGVSVTEATELAYAAKISGVAVADLAKSMKDGKFVAGLAEARREAGWLGLTLSGPAAAAGKQLTDTYARLKDSLLGLAIQAGAVIAPRIEQWTDLMVHGVVAVTNWVKANQGLIGTVFDVAERIAIAGGAMVTFVTSILPAIPAALSLAGAVGAGVLAWNRYGQAVIAATAPIQRAISIIWDRSKQVVDGVIDAIRGGNLELAVKVAWSGVQSAWVDGLTFIADNTHAYIGDILRSIAAEDWGGAAQQAMALVNMAFQAGMMEIDALWYKLEGMADRTWTQIRLLWHSGVEYLRQTWSDITQFIETTWEASAAFVASMWNTTLQLIVTTFKTEFPAISALISGVSAEAEAAIGVQKKYADDIADAWTIAFAGVGGAFRGLIDLMTQIFDGFMAHVTPLWLRLGTNMVEWAAALPEQGADGDTTTEAPTDGAATQEKKAETLQQKILGINERLKLDMEEREKQRKIAAEQDAARRQGAMFDAIGQRELAAEKAREDAATRAAERKAEFDRLREEAKKARDAAFIERREIDPKSLEKAKEAERVYGRTAGTFSGLAAQGLAQREPVLEAMREAEKTRKAQLAAAKELKRIMERMLLLGGLAP